MSRNLGIAGLLTAISLWCATGHAAHKWNLKDGAPDLASAGQLAFGPDGVLFVGDSKAAAVFAIDVTDAKAQAAKPVRNIDKLQEALAQALGGKATLNDLAVNPISGNLYLSATTEAGAPALLRIDGEGRISKLSLDNVPFQKVALPNPPEDKVTGEGNRARNRRGEAVTDLAYVDGKVLVSGVTGDKASSNVRELAFPFADADVGVNVEIYHAAHGRSEDNAAIRTFVPFTVNGEPSLLAGFTCTPLVRIPLRAEPGSKVKGTTVAELGNRNVPLDMITYEKNGEQFLLMANNNRGVMKISTQDIGRKEGLTKPVSGGGTAGQSFEKIADLEGTVQLDRLDAEHAVVVIQKGDDLTLKTVMLP